MLSEEISLPPAEPYLLMRLLATCSLREAVRDAPVGELEALRTMERLIERGIIAFGAEPPKHRHAG